jgi:hypothetical protein
MAISMSETRDRIASMVANFVGRVELGPGGELSFPYETTRVFIDVRPWGEGSTVVMVFAITNVELTPAPELYEYVALHSDDWVFGHMGMSISEGKAGITFSHTLLADRLDPEELQATVAAVAVTANEIGEKVKAQFGGRLLSES